MEYQGGGVKGKTKKNPGGLDNHTTQPWIVIADERQDPRA
jgi:hypothetical protein